MNSLQVCMDELSFDTLDGFNRRGSSFRLRDGIGIPRYHELFDRRIHHLRGLGSSSQRSVKIVVRLRVPAVHQPNVQQARHSLGKLHTGRHIDGYKPFVVTNMC